MLDINKFINTNSRYHRQSKEILYGLLHVDSYAIAADSKIKLQWYMAEIIYACERFNTLSNHKSTPEQRVSYILGGALMGMSDYIIDDVDMAAERIKIFQNPAAEDQYDNSVEAFYAKCYHTFVRSLDEDIKSRTMHYYVKFFDAQARSKRQFDADITEAEVDDICKEKCGYSLLFTRAMVKGALDESEKRAWYEIGGFIQYCNDAQDLYKDLKKGINTFATVRSTLENIAADLDKQKVIAFSLLKETSLSEAGKDNILFTLYIMYLGILAKLNGYLALCDGTFSFQKLSLKNKQQVRSRHSFWRLIPYSLPRAVLYNYDKVDTPIAFELNLKNKAVQKTSQYNMRAGLIRSDTIRPPQS